MMEGFGVHTFRLVNARGEAHFVKFHWKPKLGMHGLVWDEAQKIAGKDPDFHRRDLWEAIERGDFPEWELGVQMIPQDKEHALRLRPARPDQADPRRAGAGAARSAGWCSTATRTTSSPRPSRSPSIRATSCRASTSRNDPLLQGRLFSYTDTQISRLGGAELPRAADQPRVCPFHNFQRDGMHRQTIARGPGGLRAQHAGQRHRVPRRRRPAAASSAYPEDARVAEGAAPQPVVRRPLHARPRCSATARARAEKEHIVAAFRFELSKVEVPAIRQRMVDNLAHVDEKLARRVAEPLGIGAPDAQGGGRPAGLSRPAQVELRASTHRPRSAWSTRGDGSVRDAQGRDPGGRRRRLGIAQADPRGARGDSARSARWSARAWARCSSASKRQIDVDATFATMPSVMFDAVLVPAGRAGGADPGAQRRRAALRAGGLQALQGHLRGRRRRGPAVRQCWRCRHGRPRAAWRPSCAHAGDQQRRHSAATQMHRTSLRHCQAPTLGPRDRRAGDRHWVARPTTGVAALRKKRPGYPARRRVDSNARSLAGATGLVSSVTPSCRRRCSTSGPVAPDTSTASASGCSVRAAVDHGHAVVRTAAVAGRTARRRSGCPAGSSAPIARARRSPHRPEQPHCASSVRVASQDRRVVVHHQAAQAGQRAPARRSACGRLRAPLARRDRAADRSRRCCRVASAERSAMRRAQQRGDARADRQPQPEAGAPVALGVGHLVELLEDARLVDRRDADAVVAHLDAHPAAAAGRPPRTRRATTSTVPAGALGACALLTRLPTMRAQQRRVAVHRQAAVFQTRRTPAALAAAACCAASWSNSGASDTSVDAPASAPAHRAARSRAGRPAARP